MAVLALQGPGSAGAQPAQGNQPPSDVDKQAARRLVDAGIAAQRANEYDTAIELYNKAFALVPHPLLLFNIGQAHRLAGRLDRAAPFYERYLALDPQGPESEAVRTILVAFYLERAFAQRDLGKDVEAREYLDNMLRHGETLLDREQSSRAHELFQELGRRLGRIRVACQTQGAEVTLDGVRLFIGPGSYEGWVKAKAHEVTAKKAGHLSEVRRVAVSAGELQDVDLRLIAPSEPAKPRWRWAPWKPRVVIAAGGAIVATGVAIHSLAARNFNVYDANLSRLACVEPIFGTPGCSVHDPELMQISPILERARRQQEVAVGIYIVGGSLIAAGAVLLYMNRLRSDDRRSPRSVGNNVAIVPAISGDMFGMLINVSH